MTDEHLPPFLALVLDAMGVREPKQKPPQPLPERQFEGRFYAPDEEIEF
jgi:hypothetical protein